MKTWIVSSLDEETIQGEETIQWRKLYEEIRYCQLIKPQKFPRIFSQQSFIRGISYSTIEPHEIRRPNFCRNALFVNPFFEFWSAAHCKKKGFKKQASQQIFGPPYFDRTSVFGKPNVPHVPIQLSSGQKVDDRMYLKFQRNVIF